MSASSDRMTSLSWHHEPQDFSDKFALKFVMFLRFCADTFFAKRYGHRAIVLETVAAVPGMVGGALQHLRSLRRLEDDGGLIRKLLDEAENERMHLMTFVQIARPTPLERWLILLAQGVFYNVFFLMYLISSKTAHRVVGYFEEEAVISTPTIWKRSMRAGTRMFQRPRSRLITGTWNRMQICGMSLLRFAMTKRAIAVLTTKLPIC